MGDTENNSSTNEDHLRTGGTITLDEWNYSWYFYNNHCNETFHSGVVSGCQGYRPEDDNQDEPSESFTITLTMTDPAGAAATDVDGTVSSDQNTMTATIVDADNDLAPDVYFSAASSPGEAESTDAATNTVTVTVLLADKSGHAAPSIAYTVSGTAGTNDPTNNTDSDHNLDAGTITFGAFETTKHSTLHYIMMSTMRTMMRQLSSH